MKMNTAIKTALCAITSVALTAFSEPAAPGGDQTTDPSETVEVAVRDTYRMTMTARMPALRSGVRTFRNQSLRGDLVVEWGVDGNVVSATATLVNKSTKAVHNVEFDVGFINAMGRKTSRIARGTPVFYAEAHDADVEACESAQDPHEKFAKLSFAGNGAFRHVRTAGCTECGTGYAEPCSRIHRMSGRFTGYVDCECPDDVAWDHTLKVSECGISSDVYGSAVRSHFAPTSGKWSAVFRSREDMR